MSPKSCISPSLDIRITSFNVEGIVNNLAFLQEVLSESDILAVQEHWLFGFEKTKMEELLPSCFQHFRSCDEYEPISNVCRPTGQGGVATIWSERLNPYVTKLDDGNERILVTLFDLPESPLCLINCYLPSGTHPSAITKFRDDIGCIQALIHKFTPSYQVMILGDLNADIYNRNLHKEKLLRDLISTNRLLELGADIQAPTYSNPHLKHASRLDYIATTGNASQVTWLKARIMELDDCAEALNTSKHVPITTTGSVPDFSTQTNKKRHLHTVRCYRWDEADPVVFENVMDEELDKYHIHLLPPFDAIEVLQHSINTATAAAVPYKDVKINPKLPKRNWSPALAAASAESKQKFHLWKLAGRPDHSHPLAIEMRQAAKVVRSIQRQEAAVDRRQLLDEISTASENDQHLCHKLIRRLRSPKSSTSALLINGQIISDEDQVRDLWASYFDHLSTPTIDHPERQELNLLMRRLASMDTSNIVVTSSMVQEIIADLHNKKAQDKNGFRAEHLKLLSPRAMQTLANCLTSIINNRSVPSNLKTSYKLPLPKKGKNPLLQDNYRGITISAILGKVLEKSCILIGGQDITKETSPLQCGFTEGRSPGMATLILSEAMAEARDVGSDLVVATLDARKAFDVVSHDILRFKLFQTPLNRKIWSVIDDMYVGGMESVRWAGIDSDPYTVGQGVKQGAILSPTLYKLYINQLLTGMESANLGFSIGPYYVGTPTCADDVLLLSSVPHELQAMLSVSKEYSNEHLYELHAGKSGVSHQVKASKSTPNYEWYLGDDPIKEVSSFTHLGLEWRPGKHSPDVSRLIQSASSMAYQMLGAGLHGHNGLDAGASLKTVTTYVIPRLLHGLDAVVLSKQDLKEIDMYHKRLLRQIQGLPDSTASEAVYLLLGTVPIEATLHQRVLSLFGSVCRLEPKHPIRLMAMRQMAVKSESSKSWLAYIRSLGHIYGFDPCHALQFPVHKLAWKKFTRSLILGHWQDKLIIEAATKSTLKNFIIRDSTPGLTHPVWTSCHGKTFMVTASTTRAKLLVGRYPLNTKKAKYRQNNTNPICSLCGLEPEDEAHFVVSCPKLEHVRQSKITDLVQMYKDEGLRPPQSVLEITSAVLNGDAYFPDMGLARVPSSVSPSNRIPPNPPTHDLSSPSPCQLFPSSQNKTLKTQSRYTISLSSNITPASQLASLICQKLHIARDLYINDLLLTSAEGVPNKEAESP